MRISEAQKDGKDYEKAPPYFLFDTPGTT